MRILGVAMLVALTACASTAAAQVRIEAPYPGCEARAHECDPMAANGGELRSGQEPVRLILFGHFQDLLQRAPLNTQPPHPEHEPDLNTGFLMPTINTAETALPCCSFDNNKFLMFGSPGPVEYLDDGNWRVDQSPGMGHSLQIASPEIIGFVYLSPQSSGPAGAALEATARPGVLPGVGVHMKVNLGRFSSDDPATLVAKGDTGTGYGRTPPSGGAGVTLVSAPGEDPVYEFRVPMKVHRSLLPSMRDAGVPSDRAGFIVTAIPYQVSSGHVEFAQSDWSFRTGYRYPPRIMMDVMEPLKTDTIHLRSDGGDVVLRWNVSAALGSYDLDSESVSLSVEGPVALDPEEPNVRHEIVCHGEFLPVKISWRIPAAGLADGTYTLRASAVNRQGTYEVTNTTTFEVRAGQPYFASTTPLAGEASVPGFEGWIAVLGALAALAVRRR